MFIILSNSTLSLFYSMALSRILHTQKVKHHCNYKIELTRFDKFDIQKINAIYWRKTNDVNTHE